MLPHHEHELIRRIEKLFNVGETVIEGWEMRLWYTQDDPNNQMYIDVQKRYDVLFAAFFGDSEDSHLTLLRQNDKTLFLNSELLVRLDGGLLRLSAKSYAKGLKHVFHSLSDFRLDRRICRE